MIVLLDILLNAHKGVSLHSILTRNKLMYDYDLLKVPHKEFKRQYAINRCAVIKLFHEYCAKADPLSSMESFSDFIAKKMKEESK